MKKLEPQQLQYNIGLVKWQNHLPDQQFSLVTVHSLIVNDNPKFIQLKAIVRQFNNQNRKNISRPNLRNAYISRLYKMLCQLVRIPKMQNQLSFLNKVYEWASNNKHQQQQGENDNDRKQRPTTGSTRTRPFSAYSRPIPNKQKNIQIEFEEELIRQNPKVDFEKLKYGEKQFYQETRTLHPELQNPKKRLKEFHRKVFYQDQDELDVQILDIQQPLKQIPIVQIKKHKPLDIPNIINQQNLSKPPEIINNQDPDKLIDGQIPPQGEQGEQGEEMIGDEDVNVDDLPLQGGQEVEGIEEEEEIQDKLRPNVKAYKGRNQQNLYNKPYYRGIYNYQLKRADYARRNVEDQQMIALQEQYANHRSTIKSQLNRKAEQSRMNTMRLGISMKNKKTQPIQKAKINNLAQIQIPTTKADRVRPRTAFPSETKANLKEKIQEAMKEGKIRDHISKEQYPKETNERYKSLTSYAPKRNKKTFEDILANAHQKVIREAQAEGERVKQILAKNKVPASTQMISNTIGFSEIELPGEQIGFQGISGTGMLKNPYFKVAKKKKKKKKK